MIAKQQILVQKLSTLKNKVRHSENLDEIVEYVEEAVRAALPVEPLIISSKFKAQIKKATKIQLLQMELQVIKNTTHPDLAAVRFQLSSSLTLLISVFSNDVDTIEYPEKR